jgi:uncharacterized protein YqhQ
MIATARFFDSIGASGARTRLRSILDQRNTRSFSFLGRTCFVSYALVIFIAGFTDVENDVVRRTILIPTSVAAKYDVLVVVVIVDLA